MRAFLSTPDDGQAFLAYPGELDGPTIGMMGEWAVKEARMVLRAAEPGSHNETGYHTISGPGEGLGGVWAYPPRDGNAHAALYEALAAFVGGA